MANLSVRQLVPRIKGLINAINSGDDVSIESAVVRLSQSRRWLAPLALTVSALVMLFEGLRLVFTNWRLMALMVLPTFWLWLAMYDLRAHILRGRSFHHMYGGELWLACAAVILITIASYWLNTIMVFAVSEPPPHLVRPAYEKAVVHWRALTATGFGLGVVLAVAGLVVTRWRPAWFAVTLSIAIGLLMLAYLAGPSRILGVKPRMSRRDKLVTGAVTAMVSAALTLPGYVLARMGVFVMGFRPTPVFIFGLLLLIVGVTLHAGAGGAVKAVKVSTLLIAGSGGMRMQPGAAAETTGVIPPENDENPS